MPIKKKLNERKKEFNFKKRDGEITATSWNSEFRRDLQLQRGRSPGGGCHGDQNRDDDNAGQQHMQITKSPAYNNSNDSLPHRSPRLHA